MSNSLPPLPETPKFDKLPRADQKALLAFTEFTFRNQGNRPAESIIVDTEAANGGTQYYAHTEYNILISKYIERIASDASGGGPTLPDAVRQGKDLVQSRDRVIKHNPKSYLNCFSSDDKAIITAFQEYSLQKIGPDPVSKPAAGGHGRGSH